MTEEPEAFPLDLSHGVRAAWHGEALWIRFPEPWGLVRIPAAPEGSKAPPVWTIVSTEPLTLSPSIRVRGSFPELHGHVKNGRWQGDQGYITPCDPP